MSIWITLFKNISEEMIKIWLIIVKAHPLPPHSTEPCRLGGGGDRPGKVAIVAAVNSYFAGIVAAASRSARPAWTTMCGECRATISPGNVPIVESSMALGTSDCADCA